MAEFPVMTFNLNSFATRLLAEPDRLNEASLFAVQIAYKKLVSQGKVPEDLTVDDFLKLVVAEDIQFKSEVKIRPTIHRRIP